MEKKRKAVDDPCDLCPCPDAAVGKDGDDQDKQSQHGMAAGNDGASSSKESKKSQAENLQEDLVNNTSSEANIGNELARQPNFLATLGLNYNNQKFDALLSVNHTGSKFTDDTNNVELDAISIFRLGAGYTFTTQGDNTLRVGLSVFNLFDSDGLTEGNPRAGIAGQSADGEFFFGRPILPRRVFFTTTFNF